MTVRDGRDSVASMAKRYGDLSRAIRRWVDENTIVLAERDRPDVLVYRHEDLISDPPTVVRQVCKFLNLQYSDELLEYHQTPKLWFQQKEIRRGYGTKGPEHRALRNWQVNQPIFDTRGRWRSELSEEDLVELTHGTGRPLMQAFGYL
jgi:hypothetical protein